MNTEFWVPFIATASLSVPINYFLFGNEKNKFSCLWFLTAKIQHDMEHHGIILSLDNSIDNKSFCPSFLNCFTRELLQKLFTEKVQQPK
jgi:hypothetical protein